MRHIMYAFIAVLLHQTFAAAALQNEVSQYGITWYFDTAYEVGRFVTGDWYVVGPVVIDSTAPRPDSGRHGSAINPRGGRQGYDSRGGAWQRTEQTWFPAVLNPGQSMVTAISNPEQTDCSEPGYNGWLKDNGSCSRGIMKTQAVLTCLAAAPAGPSFRPAYAGSTWKTVYPVSAVNWNLLPVLDVPDDYALPNPDSIIRSFQRPWIDHLNGWSLQYTHAMENMAGYGRDMTSTLNRAALYILLGQAKTDSIAIRLIQLGIDNYGVTRAGGYWPPDGGHGTGRKWPILFAGLMLDEPDLKSIGYWSGDYAYHDGHGSGNLPDGYIHFGEDSQTFYVRSHPSPDSAWTPGPVWYATDESYDIYVPHPDPSSDTVKFDSLGYRRHEQGGYVYYGHGDATKSRDFMEYTDRHRGMPEWGIRHTTDHTRDGLDWNAPYRGNQTGDTFQGFVLAARILGLRRLWNHTALFEYTDRYVSISGSAGSMWKAYRDAYGCVWTRIDTADKYSNGAPDCSRCEHDCSDTAASAPYNLVPASLTVPGLYTGIAMTADPGRWADADLISYQWQKKDAAWQDIPGAKKNSYTPSAGDTGSFIRCAVTAVNAVGAGTSVTEAAGPILSCPWDSLASSLVYDASDAAARTDSAWKTMALRNTGADSSFSFIAMDFTQAPERVPFNSLTALSFNGDRYLYAAGQATDFPAPAPTINWNGTDTAIVTLAFVPQGSGTVFGAMGNRSTTYAFGLKVNNDSLYAVIWDQTNRLAPVRRGALNVITIRKTADSVHAFLNDDSTPLSLAVGTNSRQRTLMIGGQNVGTDVFPYHGLFCELRIGREPLTDISCLQRNLDLLAKWSAPPSSVHGPAPVAAATAPHPAFPNPMQDKITFGGPSLPEYKKVTVFDRTGNMVFSSPSRTWRGYDMSGRPAAPGIYYFAIDTRTGILTGKIIKSR